MKWLTKPHPFIFNASSVLIPGIITTLVILLFAPFGLQEISFSIRIAFAVGIGMIASLSVFLVVKIVRHIYPSYQEVWTVGKEIGMTILVVSFISVFLFILFFVFDLAEAPIMILFQKVFVNTVLISLIPITILVLYEQNAYKLKQLKKAEDLNEQLKRVNNKENDFIEVKAENGKTELVLRADEICYVRSDGNYLEVFYLQESLQKKLIRNRLKAIQEILPDDLFFHCHKSFIVNLNYLISVEGNARNFELKLRHIEERIPVSRSKSDELSLRLS